MTKPKDRLIRQVETATATAAMMSGGVSTVRGEVEMSQAFHEKSKQELQRLKDNVAASLKEDLRQLADDETHKDITITNGSDRVRAHRCIVQARCKHLWQENWLVETENDDGPNMTMCGLSRAQLEDFVRQIYTVNDAALLMEDFLPALSGDGKTTTTGAENEDVTQMNGLCRGNGSADECVESDVVATNGEDGCQGGDRSETNGEESGRPICVDNDVSAVDGEARVVENESDTSEKDPSCSLALASSPVDGLGSCVENPEDCGSFSVGLKGTEEKPHGEESYTGIGETGEPLCRSRGKELTKPDDGGNRNVDSIATSESELESGSQCNDLTQNDNTADQSGLDGGPSCNGETQTVVDPVVTPDRSTASPVLGTTLDSAVKSSYSFSIPYETCSPLGRDLLQMHLQEMNCDCCLAVDGVRFLAHKAVLSARSEYFAAMLGGRWSESSMELIQLEGVAPQALEQVLLFLYGGVVDLTTPCDLLDLFLLADMYGVLAFKSVLTFYVKKDLCHFFHKPCQGCVNRAPEAISLCHNFNLEELQARCLKWVSKYFTRIWPTKFFAALPESLQQLCLNNMVAQMTKQNVLDVIMDCDKLTTSLPRIKWTEGILCLLTQLMDLAIEFTSSNFIDVIGTYEFLQWAKVASWKAGVLEEIFNSVIDSLSVDTACIVYETLVALKSQQLSLDSPDADVIGLLDSMLIRCEKFLRTHIHQVTRCSQWNQLMKDTQTKILENSSYVYFADFPDPKPKPKLIPKTRSRPPEPRVNVRENRRPPLAAAARQAQPGQHRPAPAASSTSRGAAGANRSQNTRPTSATQGQGGGRGATSARRGGGRGRGGERSNVKPGSGSSAAPKSPSVDEATEVKVSSELESQENVQPVSPSPSSAHAVDQSALDVEAGIGSSQILKSVDRYPDQVNEVVEAQGILSPEMSQSLNPGLSQAEASPSDSNINDSSVDKERSFSPRPEETDQTEVTGSPHSAVHKEKLRPLSPSPSRLQAMSQAAKSGSVVLKSPKLLRAEQAKSLRSQLPVRDRRSSSPRPWRTVSESSTTEVNLASFMEKNAITTSNDSILSDYNANKSVSENCGVADEKRFDDFNNRNVSDRFADIDNQRSSGNLEEEMVCSSAPSALYLNVSGNSLPTVESSLVLDNQRDTSHATNVSASSAGAAEVQRRPQVKVVKMNRPLSVGFSVPKD